MLKIVTFGCMIMMGCAFGTFYIYDDRIFISINVVIIGVFLVPIIPIGINFSSELTFPIESSVITGTLMMTG